MDDVRKQQMRDAIDMRPDVQMRTIHDTCDRALRRGDNAWHIENVRAWAVNEFHEGRGLTAAEEVKRKLEQSL